MQNGLLKIEQIQNKLEEKNSQAIKDPLTDLFNRRYLDEISDNIISLAHRLSNHTSILMIDIDNFKHVNDIFGHDIGDKVLKTLAKLFLNTVRKSDIPIRFGGEEFIIILPNADAKNAQIIAEKLRTKIEKLVIKIKKNIEVTFTISIGVSEIRATDTFKTALKRADEALYEAKSNGKNKTVVK